MGYCLNRLDEPILMAVSKPMQTEFGIHHRLESCDLDYLKGYENGHMKGPPPLIDVYGHGEARLGHTSGWPKGPHLTELSSRDGNCRFKISFLVSLKMQCG